MDGGKSFYYDFKIEVSVVMDKDLLQTRLEELPSILSIKMPCVLLYMRSTCFF
jgi:hypothetical protein